MTRRRIIRHQPSEAVRAANAMHSDRTSISAIVTMAKTAVDRWRLRDWRVSNRIYYPTIYRTSGDRGNGFYDEVINVPCARLDALARLYINPDGEILKVDEQGEIHIVQLNELTAEERRMLASALLLFAQE